MDEAPPRPLPSAPSWHSAAAQARGTSHTEVGQPCQDFAGVTACNGTLVLCLADGAGSRARSDIGARAIVLGMGEFLADSFEELAGAPEDQRVALIEGVIRQILQRAAREHDCAVADLSSTLLAVAVRGERCVTIHVGDGVIGVVEASRLRVLSQPWNGEFANQTVFTTERDLREHIRTTVRSTEAIAGFILMSDGAASSLHVHGTETLAPAVVKLMLYCVEHPEDAEEQLRDTLESQLVRRTTDDCSVAILARNADQLEAALATISLRRSPEPEEPEEGVREGRSAEPVEPGQDVGLAARGGPAKPIAAVSNGTGPVGDEEQGLTAGAAGAGPGRQVTRVPRAGVVNEAPPQPAPSPADGIDGMGRGAGSGERGGVVGPQKPQPHLRDRAGAGIEATRAPQQIAPRGDAAPLAPLRGRPAPDEQPPRAPFAEGPSRPRQAPVPAVDAPVGREGCPLQANRQPAETGKDRNPAPRASEGGAPGAARPRQEALARASQRPSAKHTRPKEPNAFTKLLNRILGRNGD